MKAAAIVASATAITVGAITFSAWQLSSGEIWVAVGTLAAYALGLGLGWFLAKA